jgi:tetratricopeptide (TPR) repeat protein
MQPAQPATPVATPTAKPPAATTPAVTSAPATVNQGIYGPPASAAPAPPPSEPVEAPKLPAVSPRDRVYTLAQEARLEFKAGRRAEAVSRLEEAVAEADRLQLDAKARANLRHMLGLSLTARGDDRRAIVEYRRATELDSSDAELQLDLAEALSAQNETGPAAAAAERALALGLSGDDADRARQIAKQGSRRGGLRERLRIDANVTIGFDSNAANGEEYQTIAGKSTRGATANQLARLGQVRQFRALSEDPELSPQVYQRTVTNDYRTASPSRAQSSLPLDLGLSVFGRPVASGSSELWLGYRFAQTFMLFAQQDDSALLPDANTYHLQQHSGVVRVNGKPRESIDLNGSVEGFVNLSGLSGITPFLGGLLVSLNGAFAEPHKMRTLASVNYRFRRAFDQPLDGYLNGNRLQVKLVQELRLARVAPHLSYRLTYDATGVLSVQAPLSIMYTPSTDPSATPTAEKLGTYTYNAPLTYHGHQLSLGASFELPASLKALAALRYEYRGYTDVYFATYLGSPVGSIPALPSFALPEEKRVDHLISLDVAASRALPKGFALDLAYGFMHNLSNIANVLDNRTWSKHTIFLAARYSY